MNATLLCCFFLRKVLLANLFINFSDIYYNHLKERKIAFKWLFHINLIIKLIMVKRVVMSFSNNFCQIEYNI